jgi:hypothetical protein
MYCRYCLQSIPPRSARCPECGSNLLERAGDQQAEQIRSVLTPAQTRAAATVFVIVGFCLLAAIVALARPQLLPAQVIVALNLGTATPTPTRQLERGAEIATPTLPAWREHINPEAGFRLSLPDGWQVINQARIGWQNELRTLNRDYSWAERLFEGSVIPRELRSRAVSPSLVNAVTGQAVLLTVSTTNELGENLSLADIENKLRTDLAGLAELTGPVQGTDFMLQRSLRQTVNNQEALFVELTGRASLLNQPVPTRIQLYFIQTGNQVYLLSWLAEEQLASNNRALLAQISNSFAPVGNSSP